MIRSESAWCSDYFGGIARDVTPSSARPTARILFAPLASDPRVSLRCAPVLSQAERRRADRFASAREWSRFVQRRVFRRYCAAVALAAPGPLTRLEFSETASGQPHLEGHTGVRFSFSSSRTGLIGAWSTTRYPGVDLEDDDRRLNAQELAGHHFCESENRALQRLAGREKLGTFFRYWCLKEAALKSIGQGLPAGLNAFEFDLRPVPRVRSAPSGTGGAERFDACLVEGAGQCAALVLHNPA